MEEFFLFQKGDASMTVGKEHITCSSGDFISIPANTLHSLKAITDIEIITIGCAIHLYKHILLKFTIKKRWKIIL